MTGVLVVDDSRFMRTVVAGILTDHGFEVGTASDGQEAVELVESIDPDVVTMDVEMPEMDGIEATERIMTDHPTPVVMVSAHTETGADATLQALARGAVDFVHKPGPDDEMDLAALGEQLVETVEAASNAEVSAIDPDRVPGARSGAESRPWTRDAETTDARAWTDEAADTGVDPDRDVVELGPDVEARNGRPTVVIGASTGGPHVVESVVAGLPSALDARVLVVQHMPDSFTDRFAARLDAAAEYDFGEATDGTVVSGGEGVVAKGDYHMRVAAVEDEGLRLSLDRDERVHSVRPALDVTMKSVASTVPGPIVGVVLTGMGKDGAAGVEAIRAAGGTTIVQDRDTSPVFGMPEQAIATGSVDRVVPAGAIPEAICDGLSQQGTPEGANA